MHLYQTIAYDLLLMDSDNAYLIVFIVLYKYSIHMCAATIGISHPDIVVETNTLSSVPPPDVTYTLSIPDCSINSGRLSALQLEAIIYACQVLLLSLLFSFLSQMSLVSMY